MEDITRKLKYILVLSQCNHKKRDNEGSQFETSSYIL